MNHAKQTRKPIHLAFVGARASGKTSFLNMVEIESKRRDCCTVRINLNEADVATDLSFFRKLLHSVVLAAFNDGAFGGRKGKTYFSYLELTSTYEMANIEEMPFITSIQIAFALKARNADFVVPDDILADDLRSIYKELNKPIIILMDECNVLRLNRIILEKLRNIFMNMNGYMLSFAATEDFFPVMDEIFSPIMRQFKKIDIGPFRSEGDVLDCVMRPLRGLGLSVSDTRRLVPRMFIRDVDVLSGRRPYEVQLICHALFRRCQDGSARFFSLDLRTIESIQREIASGQNVDERSIIRSAKSLKRRIFSIVESISSTSERLSDKDWWNLEYLFNGTERWSEEDFFDAMKELLVSGIIHESTFGIEFSGDDFDRLYIKYIARQKQVSIRSEAAPIELAIYRNFMTKISEFEQVEHLGAIQTSDRSGDTAAFVEFMSDKVDQYDISLFPVGEDIIERILDYHEGKNIILKDIYFSSRLSTCQFWLIWSEPEQQSSLKKFSRKISDLSDRATRLGFSITSTDWEFTVPSRAKIIDKIAKLGDEQVSTRLSGKIMSKIHHVYVEEKDVEQAKLLAETAFSISGTRMTGQANNVGYLYMSLGNYAEALLWFQAALQYGDGDDKQLLYYNMAILSAMTGNISDAHTFFEKAKESEISADASCVYKISLIEEKLHFVEISDPPSLVSLSTQGLQTLAEFQSIISQQ